MDGQRESANRKCLFAITYYCHLLRTLTLLLFILKTFGAYSSYIPSPHSSVSTTQTHHPLRVVPFVLRLSWHILCIQWHKLTWDARRVQSRCMQNNSSLRHDDLSSEWSAKSFNPWDPMTYTTGKHLVWGNVHYEFEHPLLQCRF